MLALAGLADSSVADLPRPEFLETDRSYVRPCEGLEMVRGTAFLWATFHCLFTASSPPFTAFHRLCTAFALPVLDCSLSFTAFHTATAFPPPSGHAEAAAESGHALPRCVRRLPLHGLASRRRDCHSAAPPSTLGASIGIRKGCHQNDSLADG